MEVASGSFKSAVAFLKSRKMREKSRLLKTHHTHLLVACRLTIEQSDVAANFGAGQSSLTVDDWLACVAWTVGVACVLHFLTLWVQPNSIQESAN